MKYSVAPCTITEVATILTVTLHIHTYAALTDINTYILCVCVFVCVCARACMHVCVCVCVTSLSECVSQMLGLCEVLFIGQFCY